MSVSSGGSSARLYRILVAEQKIATDAGLSYSGDAWDAVTNNLTPSAQQFWRLRTALE
jgi:hypothetical protein